MPSLWTEKYQTPKYQRPYTDKQWDDTLQAVMDNRVDIDKLLKQYALAIMAKSPVTSSFVPFLSNALNLDPSADLTALREFFENTVNTNSNPV